MEMRRLALRRMRRDGVRINIDRAIPALVPRMQDHLPDACLLERLAFRRAPEACRRFPMPARLKPPPELAMMDQQNRVKRRIHDKGACRHMAGQGPPVVKHIPPSHLLGQHLQFRRLHRKRRAIRLDNRSEMVRKRLPG